MTEETDNRGSKKTIRKADVIKRILKDSFLWEDDMLFYDTMGRWWMCDNLIDKYVTVLNDPEREVFMVVDNWNNKNEMPEMGVEINESKSRYIRNRRRNVIISIIHNHKNLPLRIIQNRYILVN
jgi:hypothetical protein